MILSFAHTTDALLAGRKTVTRRDWRPRHAARFTAGKIIDAWSQLPYVAGAKQIARVRLTADAVLEPLSKMPDSDYEAEGFGWLWEHYEARHPESLDGRHLPDPWRIDTSKLLDGRFCAPDWFSAAQRSGKEMWVVRFELVEVL